MTFAQAIVVFGALVAVLASCSSCQVPGGQLAGLNQVPLDHLHVVLTALARDVRRALLLSLLFSLRRRLLHWLQVARERLRIRRADWPNETLSSGCAHGFGLGGHWRG